ncbi:MAG: COG1361 S-layer family protein [archaeon]
MRANLLVGCLLVVVLFSALGHAAAVDASFVSQSPDPADTGDIVELRFSIENTGSTTLNNVAVELLPEYPFSEVSGEDYSRQINTLAAYQQELSASIQKFKVLVDKDAVQGTYKVKLAYGGITKSFDIDISSTKYSQAITLDKSKLEPGQETTLKFTIENRGSSSMQNVRFSWEEADGVILPVYSDNTKYVKYIGAGQTAEIEYIVVAGIDANPGLYQLDMTLTFESSSGSSSAVSTKAGIFVGGETDFDVTFSESSSGQTSLSVANTGNNPAYSVTVRVPDQPSFRVSGSTASIVGNLDRGDYTIVSFQIAQGFASGDFSAMSREERAAQLKDAQSAGGAQAGGGNLKVLVEYTDTTGKRHSVEKEVPIQFRSITDGTATATGMPQRAGTAGGSKLRTYGIVLLVLAAGAVWYKKCYKQGKRLLPCLKCSKEKKKA